MNHFPFYIIDDDDDHHHHHHHFLNTRAWRQPRAISTGLLIRGMKSRPTHVTDFLLLGWSGQVRINGIIVCTHVLYIVFHLAPPQISKLPPYKYDSNFALPFVQKLQLVIQGIPYTNTIRAS